MKSIPSLLREAEHRALSEIRLSGSVLDLGGEKGSEYLSYLKGDFKVTALNLDDSATPDIFHDLEKPLPVADASYDHALLINVLEHIFEYRQLLEEAVRVIRPGGTIVIIVPFLFPVHPSPRDYWRFTEQALTRELENLPIANIRVSSLGTGVFAAGYLNVDRLLPSFVRRINYHTVRHLVSLLDAVFARSARAMGKKYSRKDYPLGYMARATKKV